MRIKIIRIVAYILLLNNAIYAFDIARYCCCLQIFKNRSPRESFVSTDSNYSCDDICYEEMLDGQEVLTFIPNPTKHNQDNNSQGRSFNVHQGDNVNSPYAQRNPMGILHGRK